MGVRNDFLGLFENAADARAVPAGETIFEEGDPGDKMYVILEGEVSVRVGGEDVSLVGAGSIFGEMALIDDSPRSASAVAKTHCRLVGVDEPRFMQLVRQTPQFALEVMKLIANRLRVTDAALGRPKN
ncbi:MAG TPA: cyclic nucleotide-binding domain-containing protein [Phycisphaerae bacterium]|nr:cyclic nucleotide-binding domain-containing protein [Phycisphaerae bacterium]